MRLLVLAPNLGCWHGGSPFNFESRLIRKMMTGVEAWLNLARWVHNHQEQYRGISVTEILLWDAFKPFVLKFEDTDPITGVGRLLTGRRQVIMVP